MLWNLVCKLELFPRIHIRKISRTLLGHDLLYRAQESFTIILQNVVGVCWIPDLVRAHEA
jgi:hypothetical protein